MEKVIIQIPTDVKEVSKVNTETRKCEDGSPIWVDLGKGNWKCGLHLDEKAEYVNKQLIKQLWNKFWEMDKTDEQYKYVDAIDYFLNH